MPQIQQAFARAWARVAAYLYLPPQITSRDLPAVDVVVDVGVAAGTPWLYDAFPRARLVLVDPLPLGRRVAGRLAGREHSFVACALGAQAGALALQENLDRPDRSSFLNRTALTSTDDRYRTIDVEVRTLDSVVAEQVGWDVEFGVKVDTEGYELEVLRGASMVLQRCAFVILEASVQERFEGGYHLEDLVCFMQSAGFGVHEVLSADRDPAGVIRFVDLLFVPVDRRGPGQR